MRTRAGGMPVTRMRWAMAALLLAGCGKKNLEDPADRGQGSGTDAATIGADAGGASDAAPSPADADTATSDAGTAGEVVPFPGGCQADTDCTGGVCRLGICVVPPERSLPGRYACDEVLVEGSKPDLDCWDHPVPLADGPAMVPARGAVEYFGDGTLTVGLRVSFYDYATFDPSPCAHVADDVRDVFEARRQVEECIDTRLHPLAETTAVACADRDDVGCYQVDALPTGRTLVVRITGDMQTWVPTYEYGVFINPCVEDPWGAVGTCPPEGAETTQCSLRHMDGQDVYYDDLTVISTQTYQTFPPTAGIPRIERGEGVIAGRQFDCRGRSVVNSTFGVHLEGRRTTFFNDDPNNILPQPGLSQTNVRGTYAELSLPAGPQGMVAVAWVDGTLRTVNYRRLYVLPNAVTFVNTPGRLPVEVAPPY